MSKEEKIKALEDEIRKTKYNKATQHHIGLQKAKLAKLRTAVEVGKKKGGAVYGYDVKKSGDASVILVGFPSVGKSTLLNAITDAKSDVGAYAFTTLTVIPGTLAYKGAKIQVLDVPGIIQGASIGKGRGKEVLNTARNADLIMIVADVKHPEHVKILQTEVENTNLRLNQIKPVVKISKASRGGLKIASTLKLTKISHDTIKAILKEYKINNADVVIRDNIDSDQLIDAIEKNRIYVPALVVFNKIDMAEEKEIKKALKLFPKATFISGEKAIGLNQLKEDIFQTLNFIRVYTKETGKKADLNEPLIIQKGSTIKDACRKLHKDFVTKFKYCKVFGKSAKFPGQKLMLGHKLKDKDIIEIHVR